MPSKRRILNYRLVLVVVVAVAAVSVGSIAWAAIPDSGGLIHACYKKPGDTLRVAADSGSCEKDELALGWLALRGFYTREHPSQIGPTPPGQAGTGTLFCNFGDHAIGGGFDVVGGGVTGLSVMSSHLEIEDGTEGWETSFTNTSSDDILLVRQVICADVTP